MLVYPNNYINQSHSLSFKDNKQYEEKIKEDFKKVFAERFKEKPSRKINSDRMKEIALCSGGIALTALAVGIVAMAILFTVIPLAAIISLSLVAYVSAGIGAATSAAVVTIPVSGLAAAIFGILSGVFWGIGKYHESDDHKSKEYCIEQANKAVEEFLESKKPFEEFRKEHQNIFDAEIIKMEDIIILLNRKIANMSENEIYDLAKHDSSFLFRENLELLENRINLIRGKWANLKVV